MLMAHLVIRLDEMIPVKTFKHKILRNSYFFSKTGAKLLKISETNSIYVLFLHFYVILLKLAFYIISGKTCIQPYVMTTLARLCRFALQRTPPLGVTQSPSYRRG